MKVLPIILIPIFVPVLLYLLHYVMKKEQPVYHVVSMPKAAAYLAVGLAVVSLVFCVIALMQILTVISVMIASCAGLLAILFAAMYFSIRVRYTHDVFWVKRILRREKFYAYTQIDSVMPGSGSGYKLYMQTGEKIAIDAFAVGGDDFLDFAEYMYNEAGLGICIPDKHSMLFRGNVKNPMEFVFVVCLLGAWIFVGAVILTVMHIQEQNSAAVPSASTVISESDDSIEGAQAQKQDDANCDGMEVIVAWTILLLYVAVCAWAYHILCYAEKHPILARLLVKKEYLNV